MRLKSVIADIGLLAGVLLCPHASFGRITREVRWMVCFFVVSLGNIVLVRSMYSLSRDSGRVAGYGSAVAGRHGVFAAFDSVEVFGELAVPVLLIVKWVVATSVFFCLLALLDRDCELYNFLDCSTCGIDSLYRIASMLRVPGWCVRWVW